MFQTLVDVFVLHQVSCVGGTIATGSPYMAGVRREDQLLIRAFYDNNHCAHIVRHRYANTEREDLSVISTDGVLTVSMPHVFDGIHCWRVNVSNPNLGEIFYGVTHPSLLEAADIMQSCTGVSHCRQIAQFNMACVPTPATSKELLSRKYCIDMLLNADTKILQLCTVDNGKRKAKQITVPPLAVFLPDHVDCAMFAPFIFHSAAEDAAFRIAKIPAASYGQSLPIWTSK